MITSKDNSQLKTLRKLQQRKHRDKLQLVVAEGEDLVDAATAAGLEPEIKLTAGEDVEPDLLDGVSALGSGTRVIAAFPQRWSDPHGELSVYLHGVRDPGNVGAIVRSAHAFADGPVILGPDCADPWSPKAVRASMGSVFTRPPARAAFADLDGTTIALERGAGRPLSEVAIDGPVVLCLGGEREGLPPAILDTADELAHIPIRGDGPDSLNVAMAAAVALYERARMARDGCPDLSPRRAAQRGGGRRRHRRRARPAGGAAGPLPGPEVRADRRPARHPRAAARAARPGRAGRQSGAPGPRADPRRAPEGARGLRAR